MWIAIFAAIFLAGAGGIFYLAAGFHRFKFIKKFAEKNKIAAWIISFAAVSVIGGIWLIFNVTTMFVVLIHLFVFWLICDITAIAVRKITKKKSDKNYAGAAAIAITAVYLAVGWYMAHHISMTYYTFETNKNIVEDDLRIAVLADSHFGITLDGESFTEQTERISAENPDIVVIAGDFVDDDSNRTDMEAACAALGNMHPKYGVFFAFGNHDKGYYNTRDFTESDLRNELEKNKVTILEDENVMINDNVCLIGRKDRSEENRMSISELTSDIDKWIYTIVIDHQPNDYEAEAYARMNLVLSGHTHGGHLFPAGIIGLMMGANDFVYGTAHYLETDFVVTSGISGWAIPFKTGAKSEIVIIDITRKS